MLSGGGMGVAQLWESHPQLHIARPYRLQLHHGLQLLDGRLPAPC